MSDIVTSRIFQDGEKNITAVKMNDIIGSSVIQPAFVSAKPSTSTIATTDNLLVLQTAGTYAKAPFQTVIDSVNAGLNTDTEIWNVRLKSFNAIGNPTFEVDQRNCGTAVTAANVMVQDRWGANKVGTMVANVGQGSSTTSVIVPGTNFNISRSFFRLTLTTAQASLATSDQLSIYQFIEGPSWRELAMDVTSISVLVRSSVAPLKFGILLMDNPATKSLLKLCTISTANTWTLIQCPNIPVAPSGNFSTAPGTNGQVFKICLAAGATLTAPANDTWQNGNFQGAVGQDNFASKAVNSTFDCAFVQLEPGSVCSTLMDCSFIRNYDEALRFYCKSYDLETVAGTVTGVGSLQAWQQATTALASSPRFPKSMAKIPTVTIYNSTNGAANSVNFSGTAYAVSAVNNIGKGGFAGFSTATMPAVIAGATANYHFISDTGW